MIGKLINEEINFYIKNIINESLTNIIYHFTTTNSLIGILRNNALKSKKAIGDECYFSNKERFISFTRMKNGNAGCSESSNVRITINGERLNQKYKAKPINYFFFNGNDYDDNNTLFNIKNNYSSDNNRGVASEGEDRIFIDDYYIPNIEKYILRIDIYEDNEKGLKSILRLNNYINYLILDKIFIYVNENDFKTGNNKCFNYSKDYDKIKKYYNITNSHDEKIHLVKNYGNLNILKDNDKYFLSDGNLNKISDYYDNMKILDDKYYSFDDDDIKCFEVELNNHYNIINTNGKLISPNLWFDSIGDKSENKIIVMNNNSHNYLKLDGSLVSPNKWFKMCYNFNDGFGVVELKKNKMNYLDENGYLIRDDIFFEWAEDFNYGEAMVIHNKKTYEIDTDGNMKEIKTNYSIK